MNLDVELVLSLVTLVSALASVIWRVAVVKREIFDYIDKKDIEIEKKIDSIRHNLELLKLQTVHQDDSVKYLIHGYNERAEHRSKRLEQAIVDINDYLQEKGDFNPRRGLSKGG